MKRNTPLRQSRERDIRFWWSLGYGTYDIAKKTGMSEAQVYNLIEPAIHTHRKLKKAVAARAAK